MLTKLRGKLLICRSYRCWCPPDDGTGGGGGDGGGKDDPPADDPPGDKTPTDDPPADDPPADDPKWDESTKAYIKNLRAENAKYRTKAKNLGERVQGLDDRFTQLQEGLSKVIGGEGEDGKDKLTPQQQVETLTEAYQQSEIQREVQSIAIKLGVSGDAYEYFEFLVGKKLETLEEGEELAADDFGEIAQKAKGQFVSNSGDTSVDGNGSGNGSGKPNPNDTKGVTVEQFANMSIAEKSLIYQKTPDLYQQLMGEARQKRILV